MNLADVLRLVWLRRAKPVDRLLCGATAGRSFFAYLGYLVELEGNGVNQQQVQQIEAEMRALGLTSLAVDWVADAFNRGRKLSQQQLLREIKTLGLGFAQQTDWISAGWRMHYWSALTAVQPGFIQQLATNWNVSTATVAELQHQVWLALQSKIEADKRANAYFTTLGLDAQAGVSEVKLAYRRLMSRYHPDKLQHQNLSLAQRLAAEQQLLDIQQAYDYLIQQLKR